MLLKEQRIVFSMIDYIRNLDNLRHNILLSYLAITIVFILDLLTPPGFGIWILYLIPVLLTPYKTAGKSKIYLSSVIITVLLWTEFYVDTRDIFSMILFLNRLVMTLILWVVTYMQVRRAQVYKKLLKSEEDLQTVQSMAHIGSYNYDLITGKVQWSREVFNIYECSIDNGEPSYEQLVNYIHPDDRTFVLEAVNLAASQNKPFEIEFRIVPPHSKVKYLYYTGTSVLDGSGKAIKRIGTVMDISGRRKAEEELRISEERFRVAQEGSPDGFLTFRPKFNENGNLTDFIFTYENLAAARMNGTKPEEIAGHGLLEIFPGGRDTLLFKSYKQVFETGRAIEFEDHYKDETIASDLWFRIVAVPISEGIAVHAQNITERKQTEKALKESQARLLDAQKLARIGNYTIDFTNDGAMEWSEEMYNIWEVDKNKPFPSVDEVWKFVHPDDQEELNRVLTEKSPGSERVETEFRIVFPSNRIKYVHIITRVIFDEAGKLSKREGVEIDITERKVAQIELEKTLLELERSNKELEQFAYVASHDLQEPLRMVASYMKLLEQRYKDKLDDKAKQYIYFAVDGAMRMSNLIKDLLVYSRVTSKAKEFERVDLNKIYEDVLNDLQILVKENGAIVSSSKLPVINADPVQMHQLLQNLIGNAIKFRAGQPPEINIHARKTKNCWQIFVKDNGIGIDADHYERIFQIFQRLHEPGKYPGTGIGLAICKKIVEHHGGRIWVESLPGKGTTFYFTIAEHNGLVGPEESDNMEILSV